MYRFETPGDVHNATPPRIVFRPGSVRELRAELTRLGVGKALIVSTAGRAEQVTVVEDVLGDMSVGVHPEAVSQVPIELAERGRAHVAELGADCLVTVGGGAATGLGKGIALELDIPIVAVPTTYSGSEMTGFCGMTIDGVKRMHASPRMLPSTVVYDAELTVTLPVAASAASAMNALAHCVDSIYLPTTSPLLKPAAVEGAATITGVLPKVLANPADVGLRQRLLYGAFLAGASLTGGFALQHGVAHALGGTFGIEHGLAHALVLPHVTSYLEEYVGEALDQIADAVGTDDLPGRLFDLLRETGLPTSLAAVGLSGSDLAEVTRIVLETDEDGVDGGVPVTSAAVDRILAAAYAGGRPSRRRH